MAERKHTPIVSEKQRGLFGAELARKRAGKRTKTGMSEEQLSEHLHESKGKDLPQRISKFLEKGKVCGKAYAVATHVAKKLGHSNFTEGSDGQKKRDEIAEKLIETGKFTKAKEPCSVCFGSGVLHLDKGLKICQDCKGTGLTTKKIPKEESTKKLCKAINEFVEKQSKRPLAYSTKTGKYYDPLLQRPDGSYIKPELAELIRYKERKINHQK